MSFNLQSAICGLQSAVCSLQTVVCNLQMSYTEIEQCQCFSVYHGRSKFWNGLLQNPNFINALSGARKHLARVDYFFGLKGWWGQSHGFLKLKSRGV